MTLSELSAALQKAAQLVGDAPIVLHSLEDGAASELHAIEVSIAGEGASSELRLAHGPAAPAAPEPAPAPVA